MLIGTIIILVVTAAFFVAGKLRSDLVALCSLLALLIFQILTPEEALSGFSNSVVIMMVGLFVVGGAIVQTGLAKMISRKVLKLAGTSELRLFLLVMLVTAVIGAFVSNTGTVALMLPIVVHGGECREQSTQIADAFGFCQQYGRYDDADWYAAQLDYSGYLGAGWLSCTLFLLLLASWCGLSLGGCFGADTVEPLVLVT